MDSDIKRKWVKALRSGKYVQGKGFFKCDGAFCCLGVLGKLCDLRFVKHPFAQAEEIDGIEGPHSWLGIVGLDEDSAEELATMNDHGSTFPEIADWIEGNL